MNPKPFLLCALPCVLGAALALPGAPAQAGPIRDRIIERMQERRAANADAGNGASADAGAGELSDLGGGAGAGAMSCADWAKRVNRMQQRAQGRNAGPVPDYKDLAYGPHALEKLDVFVPKAAGQGGAGQTGQTNQSSSGAPIILMVHGGGWCVGDKGGASMTANKVARWVSRGFIFISMNYPMVSDGKDAIAQAAHVARAAAYVQANAGKWGANGGDPNKLILMGHSAGAHLVSLVNADAQIRQAAGLRPVLGVVSLDAGAIDVVTQMPRVYPFLKTRYNEAFGTTEAGWISASPFHKLARGAAPWLGVCSTTRKDDPCGQARAYADKSKALGIPASVLPEAKSHGAINKELGTVGEYTSGVEAFMASLDAGVAGLLK
jgi:acetyl esterase/lipase